MGLVGPVNPRRELLPAQANAKGRAAKSEFLRPRTSKKSGEKSGPPPRQCEVHEFGQHRRLNVDFVHRGGSDASDLDHQRVTTTRAPTLARSYRSMTSWLVILMQPDETAWPIVSGSFEP